MRISDYTNYFQQIAHTYTRITSFFGASLMDEEMMKEKLRGGQVKPLALVLEPYSRVSMKTQHGNETDGFACGYTVLDRLAKKDHLNFSALAAAEHAALQIRARMILDYGTQCGTLDGLDVTSFRIDAVGLVANEWAGWRVEFFLSDEEPPMLNDSEWPQYTPFKSLR